MENEKDILKDTEIRRLLDLSECGMFTASNDSDLKVEYANETFYKIIQYSKEEFREELDNHLMDLMVPEEKQKIRNLMARQAAVGGSLHLEFQIQRKDGTKRWLSILAKLVFVQDRNVYYCSCMDVTQQKRNLDDIYNAKREVDLVTNSIPGGVIKLKMSDFSVLYANDGFYRLAGYNRAEYFSKFGNHCDKVVHPDDKKMVMQMIHTAVENQGLLGFEYRIISKSGDVRWSYVNGCRIDDQNGEIVYLCIIMDITAKKKLEAKFEDSIQRSKYLLEYMKETEWTYHIESDMLYRNGYLEETYSPLEEIQGIFQESRLRVFIHPEDVEGFMEELNERMKTMGKSRNIYRIKDARGNFRPFEVNMISMSSTPEQVPDRIYGETRLLDDHSFMIVKEKKDEGSRTERMVQKGNEMAKAAKNKIKDILPGLISYEQMIEGVEKRLSHRKEGKKYGILCCDVNEFRRLTYHYGLSVGREVLERMSHLLQKHLASEELCCRIKGDYFVVFFEYEKHSELLKRVSQMLRIQYDWEKEQSYVTYGMTSGIYLIQPEDMLDKADLARRSIKGTKGNHFAIYTEDLQKNQFLEEEMIADIGKAMMEHTIEICYLPRIKGDKENVIGSKAVPRAQLEDGRYLSLEDMRRYFDRSEDIQQLVFYVLSNVCCNQGAWKAKGMKIMPVSMDITASQLCLQNAVDKIDQIVKENNLEPKDIIFEIQEQYFSEVTTTFQMALADLHQRGYRVIISRFASDHTAIHSLRQLPVDGIKFHGEFFRQDIGNRKEQVVFRKIIEMAKELGMKAACGGIHTKLQEDIARSIGCDILEGDIYYGAVCNDVYEKCFLKKE